MKELTIEQKARLYDETIEKLREFYKDYDTISCLIDVKEELANLFPELKESEDERNIKDLIDELKCSLRAANCQNDACGGGHEKRIVLLEWAITWLEKQGKKLDPDKVIEWLKPYSVIVDNIIDTFKKDFGL